jgi:hypothetical protein
MNAREGASIWRFGFAFRGESSHVSSSSAWGTRVEEIINLDHPLADGRMLVHG